MKKNKKNRQDNRDEDRDTKKKTQGRRLDKFQERTYRKRPLRYFLDEEE